jgi:hypothetical protein
VGADTAPIRHRPAAAAVLAVVALVVVLAIASFAWIYGSELAAGPPLRSDATGYYLYLPAVLIDHDVTMERTAERSFAGSPAEMAGVRRVPPSGRLLDKYPVGEAIMLAPFFAAGHVAARALGAEANGFSRPYQVAAAAGGLVFAAMGMAVLGLFLLRWFSTGTVVLTMLAIVFGTNLFHYATFDAVFSHAFSFFLVALTLALAVGAYERPRLRSAVALGLTTGLLTAVRPTNAVVLVFAALVGVVSRGDVSARTKRIPRYLPLLAAGGAVYLLALVPQVAYWHTITGKLVVYTYEDEHLDLLHPHVLDVLFSVRKGLFFWSPLLLLAVAGLLLLRRFAPILLVPAVAYLVVHTWVVASWETWWYGGSLGQRSFVEALPVFALGLASLVETASGRVARPVLLLATVFLSFLAVHAMLAYWLEIIPIDGTTRDAYIQSFRRMYG